jgi:pseudouridine synthase|tara:strand:+ start:39133 stop:39819 length:687 start_codon:yes stop_codon:yes gene_type:complete
VSILIKQKKSKLLRINRFLALNLNVSRRDSDILVENKSIKINGVIANHGDLVDDDDIVMHKNQVIQAIKEHEYFLFYKPYGYVSSHKRQGESKIIYDLIHNKSLKFGGRLDKDSEGLMLLSTDGVWLNKYSHPKSNISKKYIVVTSKEINFETFRKSIKDNDEQLKIHKLTEIKKLTYEIVLKTGKNREIRRIFDVNNIPIKNLKRIQVDKFEIGKMKIGQLKKIKLT